MKLTITDGENGPTIKAESYTVAGLLKAALACFAASLETIGREDNLSGEEVFDNLPGSFRLAALLLRDCNEYAAGAPVETTH